MIDLDNIKEIYASLMQNKLRTALTVFGVSWGVFMLLIMLGSGKGLENGVTQGFGDFATNSMFVWTKRTSMPYKGFPRGRSFNFKNRDVEALKNSVPEIDIIAPKIQGYGGEGNNVIRGKETGAFSVNGDYPEYNKIDPVNILQGRFINKKDITDLRKVCVIGDRVYKIMFKPNENAIGKYLRVNGIYFKVVGVFKPKSKEMGEDKSEVVILPFTTLQKVYNYGDVVGYFAITAKENIPVSVVEQKVRKRLAELHSIHPDDKLALGGFNVEKEFKQMKGIFTGINLLVWIVGIGTLFAGVIGVSNIMLVIVKERTKEIGIKRAIGASPVSVIMQIVYEAVIITVFSGLLGLAAGTWAVELVAYFVNNSGDSGMFKNPEIDFGIAIKAILVLSVSGVFAGFVPAKRAVSVKPIDALRDE